MAGTGSTLVAAVQCSRSAIGVELLRKYADIAEKRVEEALKEAFNENDKSTLENVSIESRDDSGRQLFTKVICEDALKLDSLDIPTVDYCLTSPPYWDMLHARGFETQKKRKAQKVDVQYSQDERDIGNIRDYDKFLSALYDIFKQVHTKLKPSGYLTVVVKNIKKGGKIYPLAWDLARSLDGLYKLKDEKIWCQDNQKLAPYGYKTAWVSNTMHHYCLNFRKE
jgi:DNA modification methylase